MKQIVWLLACALLSTGGMAAEQTSTNVPAKEPSKPALVEPSVSLSPGQATVVAENLNVRGQATVHSEAITQLNPGDTVTVVEQINREKSDPGDASQWAKIEYPDKADVWVHTAYVDRNTMTVTADELNLRAGPGENYSVVGSVTKGTQLREVLTEGNWMKIAAPHGAYAFVAAMYLQQQAPRPSAPPVTVETPIKMPGPETNAATPTIASTEETPATAADLASNEPEEPTTTPSTDLMTVESPTLQPTDSAPVTEPTPPAQPPPPRVVTHEGVVKATLSIQAPTPYALVNPDTGRTVNYLLSPTTNLDLALYKGLRIVVNGEEGLDARWTNTPVITIKRIHVVE